MPPRERKRKVCSCCEIPPSTLTSSQPQTVTKRRRVQNINTASKEPEPVLEHDVIEEPAKLSAATSTSLVSVDHPNSLTLADVFACEMEETREDIVLESTGHSTRRIKRRARRTVRGLDAVHTFIKEVTYTIATSTVGYVGKELLPFQAKEDFFKRFTPASSTVPGKSTSTFTRDAPTATSNQRPTIPLDDSFHVLLDSSDDESSDMPNQYYNTGFDRSKNNDLDASHRKKDRRFPSFSDSDSYCSNADSDLGNSNSDSYRNKRNGCFSDRNDTDSDSSDNDLESRDGDSDSCRGNRNTGFSDRTDVGSDPGDSDLDSYYGNNNRGFSDRNDSVSDPGDSDSGSYYGTKHRGFSDTSDHDSDPGDTNSDSFYGNRNKSFSDRNGGVSDPGYSDSDSYFGNKDQCVSESGEKCEKHSGFGWNWCSCWVRPCSYEQRPLPKSCPKEMEELLEAFLQDSTSKKEYEILQDVNSGNQGYNTYVYLYSNEVLTICKRQQHNLRLDRTFNLGACLVTAFAFRNSNLKYKGHEYGPLMTGPVMLHFDAAPETYARFFETICEKAGITRNQMSYREMNDMLGVQKRDYLITRPMRKIFGSNMSLTDNHHVPVHLRTLLKKQVSCRSPISAALNVVYNKLFLERLNTKLAIVGRGDWRLSPRARGHIESVTDKLHTLDRLSPEY